VPPLPPAGLAAVAHLRDAAGRIVSSRSVP